MIRSCVMQIDGGLRSLFRSHLQDAHWTAIESPLTVGGIPDSEVCFPGGSSCWIEFKRSNGWAVHVRPLQVSWHLRRHRLGGRSFIAVRRVTKRDDELYLFPGSAAAVLKTDGLRNHTSQPLGVWDGGPAGWAWSEVRRILSDSR